MAEARTSGFERFNDALRGLDDQLQDLRERFDEQRKKVEGELRKRREQVREDVRGSSVFQRAEQVRKDIEDRVERGRDQIYDAFGLASKAEVQRISRKLNTITKKVNEIAKEVVAA